MNSFFLKDDINEVLKQTEDLFTQFSDKHILLTGGRGFLGRYFTEIFLKYNELLNIPLRLTVIDNLIVSGALGKDIPKIDNFEFINQDASQPYTIDKKVDFIIHAAGIASPFYYRAMPLETLDVAIKGTRNALDLAVLHSAKVLFFSSSEIYGDPDPKSIPISESYRGNVSTLGPRSCYDESKRIGETLCYIYNQHKKVDVNIVRPFNVYGPGMQQDDYRILPNFANQIANDEKLKIYGSGKQTRTYCYITDAMNGFLRIILKGISGRAYNIGNPKPEISVLGLFEVVSSVVNKKIESCKVSYPSSYPTDEPQRRCPDIDKAKKDLGYIPKISLEDGLKKFFIWSNRNYLKGNLE